MTLTLRVLLENHLASGADDRLRNRAGLSLLLEDKTTSILFDTGPDDSFYHNAALMGVSLDNLTATVLSHGHYDHCGGVPWLPENSRIICHPTIGHERFAAVNVAGRSHKLKKLSREIDYTRHRMEYTRTPLQISERFIWSGEIAVDSPKAYGVTGDRTDFVIDEGVLIYLSERGLVIITGCGHRGIINIVRHCQQITGIEKVHAIIGGFHLRCASPRTLWQVRQFLHQLKPDKVMGCHCTGAWGKLWLPEVISPATGDTFVFE
ncbi:TPA: MBL fold metallo-hydrolase [Kluyvera georgiana]|uniref:MBL fold metallo-hydrolase n=1 Tax=Kluyvera georgiana TaxID=73098 RepID=UPI002304B815|nr:MBL fold metallo-hydrolase [Kluyvera georgiana]MDA8492577.1 MBL fold metallo-hydrolase [Kluyvera georgiana]HDG1689720.1 MBL fold metallo-hydrolase [Kluyvera georgiana]